MPNVEMDEETFKKYQSFLKDQQVSGRVSKLRENGEKFLTLFYRFANTSSAPRGYLRVLKGLCKIEPPFTRHKGDDGKYYEGPQYWSIGVAPESIPNLREMEALRPFYQYLPIGLIQDLDLEKLELNAWTLAHAWGWMNIGLAIRKIFVYDYETWRWDWELFWKLFAEHTAEYGLLP